MDIAAFHGLLTPEGQALLGEVGAADVHEDALLATASRLRARHSPELVAAALTQVRLRIRARVKFGTDADRMYFTAAGLEQSTRASVAEHRARRFAAYLHMGEPEPGYADLGYPAPGLSGPGGAGPAPHGAGARIANGNPGGSVLELGCGIGGDLIARARAGCRGDGVDLDPLTATVAAANLRALGLDDATSAREGDALAQNPSGHAAVFADPGRRTARGRVFDPEGYEPPLTSVLALASAAPAGCVKVAPGIPHDAVPPGVEAEWISDGGEVKEAALWLGGLAGTVARRATVLGRAGGPATLTPDPGLGAPPVSGWRRYLYEPDGAVIRAHLVAEVAAWLDGALADPHIAYVTSDVLRATPFARAYEIDEVLPFSVKRVRAALRARDAGILTIKKRGFAGDVERLRRDLRPSGTQEWVLVLTRVGDAPIALICHAL